MRCEVCGEKLEKRIEWVCGKRRKVYYHSMEFSKKTGQPIIDKECLDFIHNVNLKVFELEEKRREKIEKRFKRVMEERGFSTELQQVDNYFREVQRLMENEATRVS